MIITVYATKSSTKTSIAVSTAVYLANKGKDVLLADLDTQASATAWLEFRSDNEKLKQIPCIQKYGKTVAKDLKEFDSRYEIVVADCGGKNDTSGRSALSVSDTVIIPVFPSSLSILTLETSLNACVDAKILNNKLKVIVVLTGCSANHLVKDTKESRKLIEDMLGEYEDVLFASNFITTRKIWMDIVALGKGITESGHGQATGQFQLLMEEIVNGDS
ncbi:chromosome partitioning protein [Bathymodiolus japonicus methanotrophic gill symbiont]|uniref:nucleotide-binding protein n=1 Tax=Bathymodiolus japonicus methanotrophic gill symbiont TaxID=113269 RepID=UPI001B47948A|nr:division plane positioning ATPase MipZ [Bathymodiolus japonicus methanotrophic gill symbiont]GFO72805.1 chromosome partitioning protein [Bathymodiolus japonicus methanotrophic gill symbiont]